MNIVVFGDSIAWGAYDPKHGGWVTHLRNFYESKANDIDVYNLAVSGETTADLLNRIGTEAKSRKPNLIVFAIGINDSVIHSTTRSRLSPQQFKENLEKLYVIASKFTDELIFVGLTPVDETKTSPIPWKKGMYYTNKNINRFDNIIQKFCNEKNLKFVSMRGMLESRDLSDGLHPNTGGHIKIFKQVKSALEPLTKY